jgi:hypothetical protein
MVKQADETSTNPGHALRELFNKYAPCLILIDEWVAYARQLHDQGDLADGHPRLAHGSGVGERKIALFEHVRHALSRR